MKGKSAGIKLPGHFIKFIYGANQSRQEFFALRLLLWTIDRLQLFGQVANFAGPNGKCRSLERVGSNAPVLTRIDILESIKNCRQLGHKQADNLALKVWAVHGVLRQVAPIKNDRDIFCPH